MSKKSLDLINSMNENGAWIESFTVHDIARTMEPNFESVSKKGILPLCSQGAEGNLHPDLYEEHGSFYGFLKESPVECIIDFRSL